MLHWPKHHTCVCLAGSHLSFKLSFKCHFSENLHWSPAKLFCLIDYPEPLPWWMLLGGHWNVLQNSSCFVPTIICTATCLCLRPSQMLPRICTYFHLQPSFLPYEVDDQVYGSQLCPLGRFFSPNWVSGPPLNPFLVCSHISSQLTYQSDLRFTPFSIGHTGVCVQP